MGNRLKTEERTSSDNGLTWTPWVTNYVGDVNYDYSYTQTSGPVKRQQIITILDRTKEFTWKEWWGGVLAVDLTHESASPHYYNNDIPHGQTWLREYRPTNVPSCANIPDGMAEFVLLGVDSSGNPVAGQKTFDFTVGHHVFDFTAELGQLIGGSISGYLVRAGKGFTAGSINISEFWDFPLAPVPAPFVGGSFEINVQEKTKSARVLSSHYLIGLKEFMGVPLPIAFYNGKIEISCSFAPLPECMEEVEPDEEGGGGGELEEEIGEIILVHPETPEWPVPPRPKPPQPKPEKPLPPDPPVGPDPIETEIHEGPDDKVKPVKPEIEEPTAPEGCACEVYVGQCILGVGNAVVQGLHNLLFIGDVIQDLKVKMAQIDARLAEIVETQNNLSVNLQDQTEAAIDTGDQISETLDVVGEYLGGELADGLEEVVEQIQWSSEQEMLNLNGLFRLEPCEPDYPDGQTIAQVADDFVKQYEPPLVEIQEGLVAVNQDYERVYSTKI